MNHPPSVAHQSWLGLDIGGANLKAAHTSRWTNACVFPMWRRSRCLAVGIAQLIESAPDFDGVAVTMTGELADCFATRAEGVAVILEQVTSILPAAAVRVYCVDGRWRSPSEAARAPWLAAASNWHALARWAARSMQNPTGVVLDIGSTTIDLIPVRDGQVATRSTTDSQRLQRGELLYCGVERSNLAGLVRWAPLHGRRCPVMNEAFATTRDAYLWLEKIHADAQDCDTSDGRPATREAARFRLARIVGEDGSTLADADITEIAQHVFHRQTELLARALKRLLNRMERTELGRTNPKSASSKLPSPTTASFRSVGGTGSPAVKRSVLLSGHGQFLADQVFERGCPFGETVRMEQVLGSELSRSAPAYAAAVLAAEVH